MEVKTPSQFQELWDSLRNIHSQHLSWINLDVLYASDDLSTAFYLYTSSIAFDTVPASVLRAFYYHLQYLWHQESPFSAILVQIFRNCSFYGCPRSEYFPFSDRIEVSGISNPDSLSLLFEIADTNELLIHDSPGLDNSSMNALIPSRFQGHEQRIAFPCMSSLEIRGCQNFSVCVLQELVKFRQKCSRGDENVPETNRIGRLSLLGLCPPLSEEEKGWFKENIEEFEFETEY